MLTRLIVDLYAWIIEIALWVMLVGAALVGFFDAVPMLASFGLSVNDSLVWKVFSALVLPLGVFLVLIVLVGPFLVLVDIRKSVRALESMNRHSDNGSLQTEHTEPHL